MELVHAALLLHSADKDVTEDNVQGVLDGAGIDVESSQVKALVAALEDVDLEEAMSTPVATGAAPEPSGGDADADVDVAIDVADAGSDAGADAEPSEEASEDADEEGDEAAPEDEGASEEEAAEGLGSLF
ncbi:MAG: 50S ribosomal protein L12 [Candidatus Nanohaloarchaea archaeon]